ncbi:hypothetical protein FAES_2820 [Fibrella aestuarina BUZ 2]|uniref:DUF4174 domain-containing protein n=2 Tax=Fibrella TaxID=861914 RepID=I0K9M6_9BACT|nr:hypothetical protein FAES_2820 [Fibrella aestuarina BUZ 2]
MRRLGLVSICLLAFIVLNIMESVANQKKSLKAILDEKKDHRRVVLLYGRDINQGHLIEQQQALTAAPDGLAERDLDVIVLINSELMEPDRQFLMHTYHEFVPSDDFAGYLIGKDGLLKKKFTKPIAADELFKTIDAMPMRKDEIKKQHD